MVLYRDFACVKHRGKGGTSIADIKCPYGAAENEPRDTESLGAKLARCPLTGNVFRAGSGLKDWTAGSHNKSG